VEENIEFVCFNKVEGVGVEFRDGAAEATADEVAAGLSGSESPGTVLWLWLSPW
jgi:hypothetical protein